MCTTFPDCIVIIIIIFFFLWLRWVFVAAQGLSLVGEWGLLFFFFFLGGATLLYSVQDSHCGGFSCRGAGALGVRGLQ